MNTTTQRFLTISVIILISVVLFLVTTTKWYSIEPIYTTPSPSPSIIGTPSPPLSTPIVTPSLSPSSRRTPSPSPIKTSLPSPLPSPFPSPDEAALIEEARHRFPEGQIAFDPPKEMEMDKTDLFEVRITQQTPSSADLTKGLPGPGSPRIEKLKIGCNVKVTLTGQEEEFKITPVTPEARLLDPKTLFEPWQWQVTPKKSGDRSVIVTVQALANFPGIGERPLYVTTYTHKISVKVTSSSIWEWIQRNWQWIISTLLIPLIGWLWLRFTKREDKPKKLTTKRKRK